MGCGYAHAQGCAAVSTQAAPLRERVGAHRAFRLKHSEQPRPDPALTIVKKQQGIDTRQPHSVPTPSGQRTDQTQHMPTLCITGLPKLVDTQSTQKPLFQDWES